MPVNAPVPGVEFLGSVFSASGYGEASRLYVAALVEAGVPVTVAAFRRGEFDDEVRDQYPAFVRLVGRKDVDPKVRIVHQNPLFDRDTAAKLSEPFPGPVVQLTAWETSRLPPTGVRACNTFDAVWVPTEWNKDVFRESGVTVPIEVFAHPHDPNKYDVPAGYDEDQDTKYTFYWIGAWQERKNPLGALRAYFHAFCGWEPHVRRTDPGALLNPYPNVRFVLKTGGTSGVEADIVGLMQAMWPDETSRPSKDVAELRAAYPEVVLINNNGWGRNEIDALHLHSNCFVALSRAEGWNLPLYEALLWGNRAVVSDTGGHSWACCSDVIPCVSVPCHSDPQSQLYNGAQLWSEPDLGRAAEEMRIFARKRLPKRDVRRLYEHLTLAAVGAEMKREIERMMSR